MPATQIEAPQGLRASADDISRLSSDANVSRIAQSGNQNLLLTRVNDLLAALDGTGQPFRREMLLGGVRDQQSWADKYSSLTDAQKRAFLDQAIIVLAENFGDQFSAGQAVRINEAFGGIVQQNLDTMFAQATAPAEAQTPARSWLESIPIIGRLFGGTPAEVVPTPAEAPATIDIGEGEMGAAIADLGVDFSEIDSHVLTIEETLAFMYLEAAYTFFSTTPNPTAQQVASFYEGVLVAGRDTARQQGSQVQDLEQVNSMIAAGLGSSGISGLWSKFIGAIGTAETRMVQRVAQNVYNYFLESESSRLRQAAPEGGAAATAEGQTAGRMTDDQIASQATRTAREKTEEFFRLLRAPDAAARGSLDMNKILLGLEIPQNVIDEKIFFMRDRAPMMRLERLNAIIRNPAFSDRNMVQMSISGDTATVSTVMGSARTAIDEAFVEPWRMVSEAWRGDEAMLTRLASAGGSLAAVTFRIPFRSLRAMFGRGRTIGERAGGTVSLGLYGLAAWQVAAWFGATEHGPLGYTWGFIKGLWSNETPARTTTGVTQRPAAPTAATQIERDALKVANAFRDAERDLGNTSFRNLRQELLLFENYILGGQGDLSTPAALRRITQNSGGIKAAQAFLTDFNTAAAGMGQDQAALLFYKMFFERYGPANLSSIIEAYVPVAERLDIYSKLFNEAFSSPTRPTLDATLFDKLKANARFVELTGPMLSVVEATLNWEGARSRRAGAVGADAYMSALAATVGLMQASDNPLSAAVAFAEQNLAEFRTTLSTIKASITNEADRLDAYVGILRFLSAPENANITDADLERQFLLQQLDRYPNLRSAVETYFYNDAEMLRKTSAYITQLTREAASEPGVGARGPTEVDVENLLRRRLSQNPSADMRNLLDVVYLATETRGRAQFDANKFTMLVDAAVFLEDNPRATADQLKQHFIDEFNARYPGLDLSTVQPDKQFDLVVALLPLRDSRGATLSPDVMLGRANGTEYWSYRTDAWLRTNFAALPPAERASSFISLPETLQIEYWNAHPDEREDLYTAAKRDRAWNAAHGTDLRGHRETRGRARNRTTVTVYPEWE